MKQPLKCRRESSQKGKEALKQRLAIFSYKYSDQSYIIIKKSTMRKLLFLLSLLVLSQSVSVYVNGTKYKVNKCELYDLNAGSTYIDVGDVNICNNGTNYFINITLAAGVTFVKDQSVKYDLFIDPLTSRPTAGQFRYKSANLAGLNTWADIGDLFIGGVYFTLSGKRTVSAISTTNFGCNSIIYFAIHADVARSSGEDTAFSGTYAECQQPAGGWFCQSKYQASCIIPLEEQPDPNCVDNYETMADQCVWTCDTGYADGSFKLNQLNTVKKTSRWGWANKIGIDGSMSGKIYTGAGQNNYNKGEIAGFYSYDYNSVDGSLTKGRLFIKFTLSSNCVSPSYHIYVGDNLPSDPVANGKFPYKGGPIKGSTGQYVPNQFGVEVTDVNKDGIWIISHFNVCCVQQVIPTVDPAVIDSGPV